MWDSFGLTGYFDLNFGLLGSKKDEKPCSICIPVSWVRKWVLGKAKMGFKGDWVREGWALFCSVLVSKVGLKKG